MDPSPPTVNLDLLPSSSRPQTTPPPIQYPKHPRGCREGSRSSVILVLAGNPETLPLHLVIVIICHLKVEAPLPAWMDLCGAFGPEFLHDLSSHIWREH